MSKIIVETDFMENFCEYLKYHADDPEPRLLAFYVRVILEDLISHKDEKTEAWQRKLDKMRVIVGI